MSIWCKKHHICEINYVWNPATYNCENGKYLSSIMDNSTIASDESSLQIQTFYILLALLLIAIALLIDVSIYCYLIKYQAKRKQLLPIHNTNNGLNEIIY